MSEVRTFFKDPQRKPKKAQRIPPAVRSEVEARSGGRCEYVSNGIRCLHRLEHLHHKRRRSQGGTDTAGNLAALCEPHHRWCHEHPTEARELGLLIFSGGPEPYSSAVVSIERIR